MNRKTSSLTKSEQEVLAFLNEHTEDLSSFTIKEVANATYTSNATIIRVCQKLGYQGFKEYKIAALKKTEARKYVKQSVDFTVPISKDENTADVILNMSNLYKESIDIVNASLKPSDIQTAVEMIFHAKKLFVYGIGDTGITCTEFINKLIKLNYYAILATSKYDEFYYSQGATENDVALIVSYSGNVEVIEKCIPVLKKNRCKIITISAHSECIIAKYADIFIQIPDKENDDKIATFYSQLAFSYIFSLFYSMLHLKIK